jgi:hypothetical protein
MGKYLLRTLDWFSDVASKFAFRGGSARKTCMKILESWPFLFLSAEHPHLVLVFQTTLLHSASA